MTLVSIATIMVTHFIALIVPGPDIFLILRTSLAHGFRQSVFACLGVGAGIVIWVVLTAFGLKALFELFPPLRLGLMAFSVGYLLYLSFMLYRSARTASSVNIEAKSENNASARRFFTIGFFTNLSNPKAVLYFASIFSNFVDGAGGTAQVALLVAIICAESVICFILLGRIFSLARTRELFLRNQRVLDGVCSAIFALFAGLIFYEFATEIAAKI